MPVFDFNNTPEPDAVPECTYTTFASDENVSSADKPLLVLDNSKKAWKHHSCHEQANHFFWSFHRKHTKLLPEY